MLESDIREIVSNLERLRHQGTQSIDRYIPLKDRNGRCVAVVLKKSDYQLLRAAAEILANPTHNITSMLENRDYQAGKLTDDDMHIGEDGITSFMISELSNG